MKNEQARVNKPVESSRPKPDPVRASAGVLLILLNWAISCFALVPSLLESSIVPAFSSMRFLGPVALLYGMFNLVVLPMIGKAGFAVCTPVLILACILLPTLFLARTISRWVRALTATTEVLALALMFSTVQRLHMQYLRGGFRGLIK